MLSPSFCHSCLLWDTVHLSSLFSPRCKETGRKSHPPAPKLSFKIILKIDETYFLWVNQSLLFQMIKKKKAEKTPTTKTQRHVFISSASSYYKANSVFIYIFYYTWRKVCIDHSELRKDRDVTGSLYLRLLQHPAFQRSLAAAAAAAAVVIAAAAITAFFLMHKPARASLLQRYLCSILRISDLLFNPSQQPEKNDGV